MKMPTWKVNIPMFTAVLFTTAKTWKQTKYTMTNRENVAYIHNVILFSHKKEWNFAFSDNMDGPRGHCEQWNKWSETE